MQKKLGWEPWRKHGLQLPDLLAGTHSGYVQEKKHGVLCPPLYVWTIPISVLYVWIITHPPHFRRLFIYCSFML